MIYMYDMCDMNQVWYEFNKPINMNQVSKDDKIEGEQQNANSNRFKNFFKIKSSQRN